MVFTTFTYINPDVLFTYLYQLETYCKNIKLNFIEILYLDTLIEFLITYYVLSSKKLTAFFKYNEITFKLLLLFFRLNSVIYMVFVNFEKPRYLIFDFGLVKVYSGKTYFELTYRYFIYDGKCFKEAITTTRITKFYGVIKITLLGVYPLKYYAEKKSVIK
jgi:hypothetical protein